MSQPENENVFCEMLKLRFLYWARLRKNRLARKRYRENKNKSSKDHERSPF